jgi:hypothetical protein
MMHPKVLLFLFVFVAIVIYLPNRCLATLGRIQFTEPLPRNDRRDAHTNSQTDESYL